MLINSLGVDMKKRLARSWHVAAAAIFLIAGPVLAQSFPTKPLRLFTGSGAGGGADLTARVVADRLGRALKTQVVVENRPGATGMVANRLVSDSAPDGYTLLLQPSSFISISPHLNPKENWDPRTRLSPVIQISSYGLVLAVHPSVPAKSVRELIDLARRQSGVLNFASSGIGSNLHIAGELFKLEAKIKITHVPYRTSPQAVTDLIAGRADFMFGLIPVMHPFFQEGRLRALAVTSLSRNRMLPDVPTVAEAGLPGLSKFQALSWEGIFAPAGTPPAIVARLNSEIGKIVDSAEVRKAWDEKGVDVVLSTPEELGKRLDDDYTRIGKLLSDLNLKNF